VIVAAGDKPMKVRNGEVRYVRFVLGEHVIEVNEIGRRNRLDADG
jgi:hypothetical protein